MIYKHILKKIDGVVKIQSRKTGRIYPIANAEADKLIQDHAHVLHLKRTNHADAHLIGWNTLMENGVDIDCAVIIEGKAHYKEPIDREHTIEDKIKAKIKDLEAKIKIAKVSTQLDDIFSVEFWETQLEVLKEIIS